MMDILYTIGNNIKICLKNLKNNLLDNNIEKIRNMMIKNVLKLLRNITNIQDLMDSTKDIYIRKFYKNKMIRIKFINFENKTVEEIFELNISKNLDKFICDNNYNNLNNIIDHKNYDIINRYIRDKTGFFYFEFYDDVKLVHLLINTKYFKKKENYSINLNKYFIEFYKVEDNKIFETNKYFSFELLKSTEFNRNMIEIFKFDISKIFFNLKKTYQKDNEVLLEDLIDLIKIISINQKKFISFINYNNLLFLKKIREEIVLYDQIEDEYKLFITNNSLDEIKLNINDKINFNNF